MIFAAGPAATIAAPNALRPFGEIFPSRNIRHHFAGHDDDRGVYAKELLIPAGWALRSHSHPYDHLSILASGYASLKLGDDEVHLIHGPRAFTIKKGVVHTLRAITSVTWFCIHPSDESDADKVDHVILAKGEP